MGYEKYFKVNGSVVEELRKYAARSSENLSEMHRNELCVYCMMDHEGESIYSVMQKISGYLQFINYCVKGEVYRDAADTCERDGDISFCGWEYSRDEPDLTENEHVSIALKSLSVLAIVVKTPDYFSESENFYEKQREITSEIDGFCETCVTCADFEIIRKLEELGMKDIGDGCCDEDCDVDADADPEGSGKDSLYYEPIDCDGKSDVLSSDLHSVSCSYDDSFVTTDTVCDGDKH